MSARQSYQPGVPCWVDAIADDAEAAMRFYAGVFGWEFSGPGVIPGDPPGEYYVARLRGRDVAGIGRAPGGSPAPAPAWNTQVSVASTDETVQRARQAGATILAEPVDAPPAGRIAVLADPTGATLCVWEPYDRQGAALVNEPSAWAMSTLHTDNPERAKAFYGELFGWHAEPFGPEGAGIELFALPGYVGGEVAQPVPRDVVAVLAPLPAGGADGGGALWAVDFWIADADAAVDAAAQLGGRVLAAPTDVPMFRRAVLADPHGAVFTISQLMPMG
jgi:predicted enzyme related to lactoylglutathione lyase